MTVIYEVASASKFLSPPALTIGNFDGVHRGHLVLFEQLKAKSGARGIPSVVMTFDPHPLKLLKPEMAPPLITSLDQKLDLIAKTGIDCTLCIPFTEAFSKISAEDFVKNVLVTQLRVRDVIVGHDYTFGYRARGNTSLLSDLGRAFGFDVTVVGPVHVEDHLVSSTRIRRLLVEGAIRDANLLLGRPYEIRGLVVKGHDRGGRLLGFPTANLETGNEIVPRQGVYVTQARIPDGVFQGVTNVGVNPTFANGVLTIETYLFDFSKDIVGVPLSLRFLERLRDERAFTGVEALTAQIHRDVRAARAFFRQAPRAMP